MADLRAIRNKRLENEYKELMRINGKIIEIEPLGNSPYEVYKVTFNIRTIVSPTPTYRNTTVCTLTIPPNYPDSPPKITVDDPPYPWHVNWYQSGTWCFGHWNREESLVNYIHRCARTLQFDPEIADPNSLANRDALQFWKIYEHNRKVIPCDKQALPILDISEAITIYNEPPKIILRSQVVKPKITIIRKE